MTIGRQYETPEQYQTSDEYQSTDQDRTTDDSQFGDGGRLLGEDHESGFPRTDEDPSQTSAFESGTSEEGTLDGTADLPRNESRDDDSLDESRDDSLNGARDESFGEQGQWETPSETSSDNDLSTDLPADTGVVETPVVDDGRAPGHALDDRWSALQGAFVDDPDTAVKDAAALVDDAMQQLLNNLQSEQSGDSSTEQKRLAFQRYRAVHEVLTRV